MTIDGTPRRRKSDVIIGSCPAIKKVLKQVSVAAASSHPVFLHGESGTGKELVARTIHATGSQSEGAFLSIHCGVIPDVLLEGELLGLPSDNPLSRFTRGSGLVAEATGGTIFLDQVEAVPRRLQARLIAVLTGGEPLTGTNGSTPRLIAASSKDLKGTTQSTRFDHDLLMNLNPLTIELPPLRDRSDDIPIIATHFLHVLSRETTTKVRGFTQAALTKMLDYPWPGNVRELENKVRQAVLVAKDELLDENDLFLHQPIVSDKVPSFKEAKRQFEKQYISQILRVSRGNISRAARMAQKDRKDFYDVMRRNGLDPKAFRRKDLSGT
jgi:two-component system response regulator GlrR